MSINNFTDAVGFSISGLQNIALDSINGNPILSTIIIAGQTAFLSYDSTTSTLTLFIPTSDGVVALGLLSATDWNTFNGKENGLTFTSPLTRVGNTISFDFTQSLTFDGNTQTLNNNTIVAGGFFYTGATSTTTGYILYIDNATGYITKGAVPNILPENNTFTGINTFSNLVNFNSNIKCNALPYAITPTALYIDGTGLVSYGASSNLLPSNNVWTGNNTFDNNVIINFILTLNASPTSLNILGDTYLNGSGLYFRNPGDKNHGIQYKSDFDCPRIFGYGAGAEFGRQQSGTYYRCAVIGTSTRPMEIFRDFVNAPSDKWEFTNFGEFKYTPPTGGVWSLSSSGMYIAGGAIFVNNITDRNELNLTEFQNSPLINSWIATTHSNGTLSNDLDGDKVVIGNIYPANPSYGATIGSHNYALNAWRDLYVNLGGYTIMPSLIVTVNFSPPSDRRLKDEIRYLDSGKSIDFIKRLKPCIYKRVDKRNIPNFIEPEPKLQHGFIADEIEEIAVTEAQKNLVDTFEFNGYKDCRKLAILNLIPEIVQANKEMIDKIERLEQENKTLLERLSKIENIIKNKKCIALI
jgi:hypothetical protein